MVYTYLHMNEKGFRHQYNSKTNQHKMQIPSFFTIFFSICLSLYADSGNSSWNVEVELFFDVVVASKALVLMSIPLLHSEEFHLSLTPGQSRKSFVLQINQVRSVHRPSCVISYIPSRFPHFWGNITLYDDKQCSHSCLQECEFVVAVWTRRAASLWAGDTNQHGGWRDI